MSSVVGCRIQRRPPELDAEAPALLECFEIDSGTCVCLFVGFSA